MAHISRRIALGGLAGSLAMLRAPGARAADTLRVGKSVSEVYGYVPLDMGMEYGLFAKHGEIEEINFAGGTKMAQAVVAGAIDISLSAGPEMALIAKGAPEIAVATITDLPAFMGLSVGSQYAGNGIESLRGKKIGITTNGSLTDWLVQKLNQAKGWTGADRATAVAVGGAPTAAFAALRVGQIDADVGGTSTGYQLEGQHAGRLLIDCSEYVKTIELFTIFASNALIARNPDALRRFLEGWFESVKYMQSHKAESVTVAAKVTGYTTEVTTRMYDTLIDKFSLDGKFRPAAIETLRASFADFNTLPAPIDMAKLYTEQFLPKGSRVIERPSFAALVAWLVLSLAPTAHSAETLRVGKAVAENFGNIPLDVGMQFGIFEKNGLAIEELNFAGGAKLAQGVAAGAVDIALSGGPDMSYAATGAPEIAVGTIADSPAFMGIAVGTQFTGNGVGSLKGRKIGVTSAGSTTFWLVDELNRAKGWSGADAAVPIVIGGSPAAGFAALKTGQMADVGGTSTGYQLEEQHAGRLLIDCAQYVNSIELFTVFASIALIDKKPEAVRRFLKGWYEAIAFMRSHKAETVPLAAKVMGYTPTVAERMYDTLMAKFSTDGRFDRQALATLEASFVAMKTFDRPIDLSKLYTEQFLPKS